MKWTLLTFVLALCLVGSIADIEGKSKLFIASFSGIFSDDGVIAFFNQPKTTCLALPAKFWLEPLTTLSRIQATKMSSVIL